jgi:hypothetical protein
MPPIHASKCAQKDTTKAAIGKAAGQSGGGGRSPDGAAKSHVRPSYGLKSLTSKEVSYIEFTPKFAMKNRVLFAIRLGRWCLFSAGCDDF